MFLFDKCTMGFTEASEFLCFQKLGYVIQWFSDNCKPLEWGAQLTWNTWSKDL